MIINWKKKTNSYIEYDGDVTLLNEVEESNKKDFLCGDKFYSR